MSHGWQSEATDGPTGGWGLLSFSLSFSLSLPIYLPTYLPIYVSIYLSICLSVCLSIYLSVCLSVCLSFYLSISLSLSIYRSIYLSNLSIYLIYLPTYLSIHPSIYFLPICPSTYPPIYLSIHPSIHASIHPSIWPIYLSQSFFPRQIATWSADQTTSVRQRDAAPLCCQKKTHSSVFNGCKENGETGNGLSESILCAHLLGNLPWRRPAGPSWPLEADRKAIPHGQLLARRKYGYGLKAKTSIIQPNVHFVTFITALLSTASG